jgi:hypoxanthine phosphoribosyltransferase
MHIVEKYASCQDKLYMTIDEATELAHELARRAKKMETSPDYVVGIANGGLLLTKVIATDLNLPFEMLTIRRRGSLVKEKLGRYSWVTKIVSMWYKNERINPPLIWIMKRMEKLSSETLDQSLQHLSGKHILLVDDAIETGQTVTLAKNILRQSECLSVTTSVATWSKNHKPEQEVSTPEIFIGRTIQHYPWSYNSPFFMDYEHWVKQNDQIDSPVIATYDPDL